MHELATLEIARPGKLHKPRALAERQARVAAVVSVSTDSCRHWRADTMTGQVGVSQRAK
jgi:hypothetical protein